MTTQDALMPGTAHPSLWRNRDYMLVWSGQFVSILGSGISGIALPLLVLHMTHAPAQVGFMDALSALPFLVLSLPVGAFVDRMNRKRLMIRCNIINGVLMGSIALAYGLGQLTLLQLYVVALLGGTTFLFFNLAEASSLPRVVPKEQLPQASAQNEASGSAASLVAPPLGGFLFGTIGATVPFVADAVSYVVAAIGLSFVRTEFQEERTVEERNIRAEIAEGVRWLWHQPLIRFMAFLVGGLNFGNAASSLLLIVLAQRQGAPPAVIGTIFTIGGIGGLLGAVIAPRIQRRFTFAQVIITSLWVSAAIWPLYAVVPNTVGLGIVFAVVAANIPVFNAVQFSYRLSLIPDALQGRVNSAFRMLAFGFQPLGGALGGVLIQVAGPKQAVMFFSVVTVGLAVATTINGHVRRARRIADVQAV